VVTAVARVDPVDDPEVVGAEVVEVDAAGVEVVVADAVLAAVVASAGSWPETSWTKIPPVVTTNRAAARPTTRRRMRRTRRRRACSGVESCGGVIGSSLAWAETAMDSESRSEVATV
jgi:hypothetical protein